MMMTDYDNDNSHDADEHGDESVWCLERGTPCQPVLVKVLRAAPPTHLRIKIQRRSQTNLSAGPCLRQSAFYYALNGTVVAP